MPRNGRYGYGRSRHSYACCDFWHLKSLYKQGDRHIDKTQKKKKKKKKRVNLTEKKRKLIPIESGSSGALSSLSELEILFFRIGTSLGSSRMSSNPSEDKSVSGPRVVEPRMEEGVTTREALSFAA